MPNTSQEILNRIREIGDDPKGYLQMVTDRMSNAVKGRKAVADSSGLGMRNLTTEERANQMMSSALDNLGGGGLGALGVIKGKGGNWLNGSVEGALSKLGPKKAYFKGKIPTTEELLTDPELMRRHVLVTGLGPDPKHTISRVEKDKALSGWIDNVLTKYIKNEMATPNDPVRLAADAFPAKKEAALTQIRKQIEHATNKRDLAQQQRGFTPEMMTRSNAEIRELEHRLALEDARQGLHFTPDLPPGIDSTLLGKRAAQGQEPWGRGKSDVAKQWEGLSDDAIQAEPASTYQNFGSSNLGEEWVNKLDPNTPFYQPTRAFRPNDLGLDHMVDELINAMNPESGLPKELLLDFKNLNKMTVPQISEHVDKINAFRAASKKEANAGIATNPAAHLVREYAENNPNGLRWVELKQPETLAELPSNMAITGDANSGFKYQNKTPDRYGSVHTSPPFNTYEEALEAAKHSGKRGVLADQLKYEGDTMQHCVGGYCDDVVSGDSRIFSLRDAKHEPHVTIETRRGPSDEDLAYDDHFWEKPEFTNEVLNDETLTKQLADKIRSTMPLSIVQIKGKQNLKPKDEYLPFVQDFVKNHPEGGQWGDVQDLSNAGMLETAADSQKTMGMPRYMTSDERDAFLDAWNAANPR